MRGCVESLEECDGFHSGIMEKYNENTRIGKELNRKSRRERMKPLRSSSSPSVRIQVTLQRPLTWKVSSSSSSEQRPVKRQVLVGSAQNSVNVSLNGTFLGIVHPPSDDQLPFTFDIPIDPDLRKRRRSRCQGVKNTKSSPQISRESVGVRVRSEDGKDCTDVEDDGVPLTLLDRSGIEDYQPTICPDFYFVRPENFDVNRGVWLEIGNEKEYVCRGCYVRSNGVEFIVPGRGYFTNKWVCSTPYAGKEALHFEGLHRVQMLMKQNTTIKHEWHNIDSYKYEKRIEVGFENGRSTSFSAYSHFSLHRPVIGKRDYNNMDVVFYSIYGYEYLAKQGEMLVCM